MTSRQWSGTVKCPVHDEPVPLRTDGALGGYCPKCLGEAANALERMGYAWRLRGYAALPARKRVAA